MGRNSDDRDSESDDYEEDQDEDSSEEDEDEEEDSDDDIEPPPEEEEEEDDESGEEDDGEDEDEDEEEESEEFSEAFKDEPGTSALVPHEQQGRAGEMEELPPDEDIEARYQDKEEKPRSENRGRICLLILCCCCLILVVAGVVLGLLVFAKDDDDGATPKVAPAVPTAPQPAPAVAPFGGVPPSAKPPPTIFPTVSPAPTPAPITVPTTKPSLRPTSNPTITFEPTQTVPDEVVMPPDQDTFIYVDGFSKSEAQGTQDSMLVQNGLISQNEIPDAFILMTFDFSCCGMPAAGRIQDRDKTAFLELNHVPSVAGEGATYTVVRLTSTPLNVETLFGGTTLKQTGVDGPSFEVTPSDTIVRVDITDLVFGDYPLELNQLYLQIENRGAEQTAGDRFYSRESLTPPQLFIGLPRSGGPLPTQPPTKSEAPSSSRHPTTQPSLSDAPSQSATPTSQPSLAPSSIPTVITTVNSTSAPNDTSTNG
jgi:hypothetical protein